MFKKGDKIKRIKEGTIQSRYVDFMKIGNIYTVGNTCSDGLIELVEKVPNNKTQKWTAEYFKLVNDNHEFIKIDLI